jgi:uncharacterized protein YrrD
LSEEGRDPVSWLLIERGWTVFGGDGNELGRVDEVLGDEESDIFDGLAVSLGLLAKPLYLPAERVVRIEVGHVHTDVEDASALGEYEA